MLPTRAGGIAPQKASCGGHTSPPVYLAQPLYDEVRSLSSQEALSPTPAQIRGAKGAGWGRRKG